jgi:phytanoyl-CoA hydroxylase
MPSLDDFEKNGAFVIPQFACPEEVARLRAAMDRLIKSWNPSDSRSSVFSTDEDQHIRNSYFLDSAENVSFFLETDAVDPVTSRIRSDLPKSEIVNKVGHALHVLVPEFRDYCHSQKVSTLLKRLGYVKPVLPQTMYIFKQPRIGGTVTSHQDSTFLHTEPEQTCLGLWLALHDADLNNGCLWFRPGSHREPLRRRFVRNPDYESGNADAAPTMFVAINPDESKWEGKLPGDCPDDLRAAGFLPVPVKAGDLVGIHGLVDHLSLANTSGNPRHSFQMHLIDSNESEWSKENWLQYKNSREFERLYRDS